MLMCGKEMDKHLSPFLKLHLYFTKVTEDILFIFSPTFFRFKRVLS